MSNGDWKEVITVICVMLIALSIGFVLMSDNQKKSDYIRASKEICRQLHECDDLRKRLAHD